jgi:hypothetical protein
MLCGMENLPQTKTPESMANYEGNASLLLIERLKSKKVKSQIVDLMLQAEQAETEKQIEVVEMENGNFKYDTDGKMIFIKTTYTPKTKKELEEYYDARLNDIEKETVLKYVVENPSESPLPKKNLTMNPYESPSNEFMIIGGKCAWTDDAYSVKQMSIIEAHEKGHVIRNYLSSDFLDTYFQRALDLSAVDFDEKDLGLFRKVSSKSQEEVSDNEVKQKILEYMGRGGEICERMSQLKNYFGMTAEDVFTKEHLAYAREHYIQDTATDNYMKLFFQAITPEKEDIFIEIINSAGI